MSRPTQIPIAPNTQNWDSPLDANLTTLMTGPFGGGELDGSTLDESNLNATYPPGGFERCFIWVNHSTLGWVRYVSTSEPGAVWRISFVLVPPTIVDSVGGTAADLKVNELLATLRIAGIIQ